MEKKEFYFNENEIQIIVNGLGKLPAEVSFNVLLSVKNQVERYAKTETDTGTDTDKPAKNNKSSK